jgi:hypothetical protein
VPAGQNLTLTIAPPTSTSVASGIATFTYNLVSTAKYQLVASGIVSTSGYTPGTSTAGFNLIPYNMIKERAINNLNTDVVVFHGATDAPAVNVLAQGVGTLVTGMSYGTYNSLGYLNLASSTSAGNYTLHVTNTAGTATVASYQAPLNTLGLAGSAITILASGFLNPANNSNGPAFGLWVALASGGSLIALPAIPTTVGIRKMDKLNSSFVVYPNPFTNEINIKNSSDANMEVVVFDITGKRILTKNTNSSTVQLSTEELTSGVYFVKVTSEGSSSTYKVVK